MILYTHNNKLVKIRSGLNAGKLIEKYVAPPPPPDEVTIGTQTWKTKNLAIDDGGSGIYFKDQTFDGVGVITQYFYTIAAVNRILTSMPGWRLPTKDDWDTLFSYVVEAKKLKSVNGWATTGFYGSEQGTDDYGFCALPISSYYYDNHFDQAVWWTSTRSGSWQYLSQIEKDTFNTTGSQYPNSNAPVRLIKDQP